MMRNLLLLLAALLPLGFNSCNSRQPAPDSGSASDTAAMPTVADTAHVQNDSTASPVSVADTIATDSTSKKRIEKKHDSITTGEISYIGEQAIIYKTRKDYSNLVPVTMNADKTNILAYPSPKDLYRNGKTALPVKLKDGYWLDNRGINANSVFLKLTYVEYSKLRQAPLIADLLESIEDKDPFLEIYNLGTRTRYRNEVQEINDIISRGALKKFKKIK